LIKKKEGGRINEKLSFEEEKSSLAENKKQIRGRFKKESRPLKGRIYNLQQHRGQV
jgi:hypothetical protein